MARGCDEKTSISYLIAFTSLVKFALNLDPLDPTAKPLLVTMLLKAAVPKLRATE
jgi:hypothetical protein